jgi:hypothetical protein
VKLSADDQIAVLLRARALLAQPDGWKNGGRYDHIASRQRYRHTVRLTLGEACHQAAFELGLTRMKKSKTYTVAIATGLLKVIEQFGHKSLAGFNDDPATRKTRLLSLIDRRLVDLL